MNRTTVGICLATLLINCSMSSILWADELVMRDNFFVSDETRHQWVTEYSGRAGMLAVSGALLSSPCILDTSEIKLPLQGDKGKYEFNIKLSNCGDGLSKTSELLTRGNDVLIVKQQVTLKARRGAVSENKSYKTIMKKLRNGYNEFIYYVDKEQYNKISKLLSEETQNSISDRRWILLQLCILYE